MGFTKIDVKEIDGNVFKMTDDDWFLITAGDRDGFNTMTAKWGAFGTLWRRTIAKCYITHSHHTLGFIERADHFTISFYDEKYRPQLSLCGTKSGRDIDKVKETGFTPVYSNNGAVYFDEARLVIVCKKIYAADFEPDKMSKDVIGSVYSGGDYHRMYIGEIIEVLKNEG